MIDCNLVHQSNTSPCAGDQTQQHSGEEFYHPDLECLGHSSDMKNLSMPKWPFITAL